MKRAKFILLCGLFLGTALLMAGCTSENDAHEPTLDLSVVESTDEWAISEVSPEIESTLNEPKGDDFENMEWMKYVNYEYGFQFYFFKESSYVREWGAVPLGLNPSPPVTVVTKEDRLYVIPSLDCEFNYELGECGELYKVTELEQEPYALYFAFGKASNNDEIEAFIQKHMGSHCRIDAIGPWAHQEGVNEIQFTHDGRRDQWGQEQYCLVGVSASVLHHSESETIVYAWHSTFSADWMKDGIGIAPPGPYEFRFIDFD